MRIIDFNVGNDLAGKTVLHVLKYNGVSRRLITKLKQISDGITKNGIHTRTIDTVQKGDIISIKLDEETPLPKSENLTVPIVYEDDDVIVFDKPAFMPVHPSFKHQGDTLGNFFATHCEGLTFRPINRLDRDTSGLCVVAKNRFSATHLQKSIDKTYFAIVEGKITAGGTINKPIARIENSIIKRCISEKGQKAVTHYEVLTCNESFSLLKIKLETGRTHQIRVHFSSEGFPLAGDDMYGGSLEFIKRQALHCGEISFLQPINNKKIILKSKIPHDMKNIPL